MPLAIPEFQLSLTRLAHSAGQRTTALLSRVGRLTLREARAFITDAYPELLADYIAAAGDLTAQWYSEQPTTSATVFVPQSAPPPPDEQLAASGRWALGTADPVTSLGGSATRTVFDASRDTVQFNAELEPGTRWARYASANACSFCRIMATRGAVYRTEASASVVTGRSVNLTSSDYRMIASGQITREEALKRRMDDPVYTSARMARKAGKQVGDRLASVGQQRGTRDLGEKWHDNCHCVAVPVREGDTYEPPDYVQQWERDYVAAVKESKRDGKTRGQYGAIDLKAVTNAMDRARRAQNKTSAQ